MNELVISLFVIIGTIIAYLIAKWVYARMYTPLLLPVFVATVLIVIFLLSFNISYDTYMIGGEWINKFLGPAVEPLAHPLYQHRDILKRLAIPIIFGTFIGALVGIISGVLLAKDVGFDEELTNLLFPS